MNNDWREMDTAPKSETVLICQADCTICTAEQIEEIQRYYEGTKEKSRTVMTWYSTPARYGSMVVSRSYVVIPKMWQPLPLPPKHLYERKLTADLLEKQIKELRS